MIDPIVGARIGAAAASVVFRKLREPSFQRRLAQDVASQVEGPISWRALARWLCTDSAYELLADEGLVDLAPIVTNLEAILNRSRAGRKLDAVERADYLHRLAHDLRTQLLVALDPSSGIALADARAAERMARLEAITSSAEGWLDSETLGRLPAGVLTRIEDLASMHPGACRTLVSQLAVGHEAIRHRIHQLLEHTPAWLQQLPGEAWWAIGDFARFHSLGETAADCYERARASGAETVDSVLLVTEALVRAEQDRAAAEALLRGSPDEKPSRLTELALRSLLGDPDEVVKTAGPLHDGGEGDGETLRRLIVASALANLERYQESRDWIQSVIDREPERTGANIMMGRVLALEADAEPGGSFEAYQLQRASIAHLHTAMMSRLSRGSPATEELSLLVKLHGALGESATVVALFERFREAGLGIDHIDIETRVDVALALLDLDRADEAEQLSRESRDPFLECMVCAFKSSDTERSVVERHLREALDVADSDRHRALVLANLAAGGYELQDVDQLENWAPETATLIKVDSAIASDDYDLALSLLLDKPLGSVQATARLAFVHRARGNPRAAITVLSQAARQFNALSLLSMAYDLLRSEGDDDAAQELALAGLATIQSTPHDRYQLRARLMQLANERGDLTGLIRQAEAACVEQPRMSEPAWHLIRALAEQNRWQAAKDQLDRRAWLEAEDEWQAEVKIRVLGHDQLDAHAIEAILALVDKFDGNRSVEGIAAVTFLRAGAFDQFTADDDQAVDRANALAAEYVRGAPDSRFVQTVHVDTSSIEGLRDSLRPHLEDRAKALGEIWELYECGRMPLGAVADLASVPQAAFCVSATVGHGAIVAIQPDEALRAEEVRVAWLSSTRNLVIDVTALATIAAYRELLRPSLYGALHIPESALIEISRAVDRINDPASGVLTWDAVADVPLFLESDADGRQLETAATERLYKFAQARCEAVNTAPIARPPSMAQAESIWGSHFDTVNLALSLDLPLLSDDVTLRALASELGIEAFSTYATIERRYQDGELDDAERRDLLDAVCLAGHVALPFDEARFYRMLASGRVGRTRARTWLSRAEFWAQASAPLATFDSAISQLALDPGLVAEAPLWIVAAARGASRALVPGHRPRIQGMVLASSVLRFASTRPDAQMTIADAARLVTRLAQSDSERLEHGDPLVYAAKTLFEISTAHGDADPARIVLALFAGLDEDGTSRVSRGLLDDNWSV